MFDEGRVVVVGSGPAGAAAIARLAEAGVPVTLLEAGRKRAALGLTVRVAGLTVARIHRELKSRSEGLVVNGVPEPVLFEDVAPGGLSNHWSCAVPRFSRQDFLDARRAGDSYSWPIDYDDLVSSYEWVEPLLRISGSNADVPQLPACRVRRIRAVHRTWKAVAELAAAEGQGLVAVPYTYGAETTLTLSGTVFNSFVRLIEPARRTGDVVVRYGARVTRLEWSGTHQRVTGVIFRDARTGADHRVPCRAVVLAAGAVNTAKLLLQSTDRDFPHGLGNTEGVLGRYLHDHPVAKVELALGSPLSFRPAAYLTRAPLESSMPLYAAACLQWGTVPMLAKTLLSGQPGRLPSAGFNIFGTLPPAPENFVAIEPSQLAQDGTPKLVLNIHYPPQTEQTLLAARDRLVALLDRAHFRPKIQKWWLEGAGSAVHYAGTCRMHASSKFGMLDSWGRLHAVRNVIVADSAAFTTGPEKNPALTAMALAARASARLAEDLRSGAI